MARKSSSDTPAPDFEKSLQELESLVAQLERGDLPLADSLTLFEKGVALTRTCHDALAQAQQKVSILLQQGAASEPQPFETTPDTGNE